MDISTREITSEKVRGSKVDFLTTEITSKKVRGNNVDFSTIEITSKKVHGNDLDFSISEISSKKYEEMTSKFAEIWSPTYRRNIHVESTWSGRWGGCGNMWKSLSVLCSSRQHYYQRSWPLKLSLKLSLEQLSLIIYKWRYGKHYLRVQYKVFRQGSVRLKFTQKYFPNYGGIYIIW